MTDSFRAAVGRKVVSRASAEVLGTATHVVVDPVRRRVDAIVVGKGRKARLVEWVHVSGFGPDAIMVVDDQALRGASDDRERAVLGGRLELLDKRVLRDDGTEVGTVDDVLFDPEDGALDRLVVAGDELSADRLLGSGSYAVIVSGASGSSPAERGIASR